MTTELTAIRKKLEKKLKEERYIHTPRRHVHRMLPWLCAMERMSKKP